MSLTENALRVYSGGMDQPLLAPTFLFRFTARCLRCQCDWARGAISLAPTHRLPCFAELEGRPSYADLRAGWNEAGLFFTLEVSGKKQLAWCRETKIEDSDGLQLWIDTRDTQTIHRAGRFCHRFALLPFGSGRASDEPVSALLAINRARESPRPIDGRTIGVRSERRSGGYALQAHIPAAALTGFDPVEQPRLGFSYAISDRELGVQTFSVGPEFPIQDDPSLWGTLELMA
jgi:hypothetical protein